MDQPGGERRGHGRRSAAIAIAAMIVVLITIIATIGAVAARRYENYLSGYWVGDPGFLQKARLKDMQLFIAPEEDGRRQGYLLMTDLDGGFVSNQAVEIRERSAARRWWTALGSVFKTSRDVYSAHDVEVEYDGVAPGEEAPMPGRMKLALSILDGTLTLYDGEKVYAFLEKDLLTSTAAVEAYAA